MPDDDAPPMSVKIWMERDENGTPTGVWKSDLDKQRLARIEELEAALRGLVEAVKIGEAVTGAEAMGVAEAVLANQK